MSVADPVPSPALLAARAEAELARTRFTDTLGELQHRLAPSTLARNAWDGVRDKGEAVAEQTVEFALEKPAVAGAAAAAVAAFVIRRPIGRLVRRIFRRKPKVRTVPAVPHSAEHARSS